MGLPARVPSRDGNQKGRDMKLLGTILLLLPMMAMGQEYITINGQSRHVGVDTAWFNEANHGSGYERYRAGEYVSYGYYVNSVRKRTFYISKGKSLTKYLSIDAVIATGYDPIMMGVAPTIRIPIGSARLNIKVLPVLHGPASAVMAAQLAVEI